MIFCVGCLYGAPVGPDHEPFNIRVTSPRATASTRHVSSSRAVLQLTIPDGDMVTICDNWPVSFPWRGPLLSTGDDPLPSAIRSMQGEDFSMSSERKTILVWWTALLLFIAVAAYIKHKKASHEHELKDNVTTATAFPGEFESKGFTKR